MSSEINSGTQIEVQMTSSNPEVSITMAGKAEVQALAAEPKLSEEAGTDGAKSVTAAAATQTAFKKKQNRNRRDRRKKPTAVTSHENVKLNALKVLLDRIAEECQGGDKIVATRRIKPLVEAAADLVKTLIDSSAKSPTSADGQKGKGSEGLVGSPSTTEQTAATNTQASPASVFGVGMRAQSQQKMMGNGVAMGGGSIQIPPYMYKPMVAGPLYMSMGMDSDYGRHPAEANLAGLLSPKDPKRARDITNMLSRLMTKQKRPISKQTQEALKREKAEAEVRSDLRRAESVKDYRRILRMAESLKMDHEIGIIKAQIVKHEPTTTESVESHPHPLSSATDTRPSAGFIATEQVSV